MTESGLIVTDLVKPQGEAVVPGQEVTVHYSALLETGVEFDSSYDRGKPITYPADMGKVPAGFDEGVLGMVRGGVRRVVVPPALAYGERGIPGKVPPDAIVTFKIELMEVGPPPPPNQAKVLEGIGVEPSEFVSG